jgi:hypothetical protein
MLKKKQERCTMVSAGDSVRLKDTRTTPGLSKERGNT